MIFMDVNWVKVLPSSHFRFSFPIIPDINMTLLYLFSDADCKPGLTCGTDNCLQFYAGAVASYDCCI